VKLPPPQRPSERPPYCADVLRRAAWYVQEHRNARMYQGVPIGAVSHMNSALEWYWLRRGRARARVEP
jgi:hypothetical protein